MNNIDFDAIDLTKEAPVTEPERQYYYIAKARKYVSEKAQEIGRDLTFCVTTFGCQMNARFQHGIPDIIKSFLFPVCREHIEKFFQKCPGILMHPVPCNTVKIIFKR